MLVVCIWNFPCSCSYLAHLPISSCLLLFIIIINIITATALAQIPISTFSHIWVFVCQYGIMFVIIVIIIIIIIIIYRKVKVSTL